MNSKMLELMDEELQERESLDTYDINPEDAPDACHACYATGKVIICGYCEDNIQHSNCDDTYEKDCPECNGTGKVDVNSVPHSELVYKDGRDNTLIDELLQLEMVTSGE